MQVECCWNDAHGSTMTEDRANPAGGEGPGRGAQSLVWWGIQQIAAVWKRGLKAAENGLVSESCQDSKVAKAAKKIRARGADFSYG